MKEFELDARDKLLIAIGFLAGRFNDEKTEDIATMLIMSLCASLDYFPKNLKEFVIPIWIEEIIGRRIFS